MDIILSQTNGSLFMKLLHSTIRATKCCQPFSEIKLQSKIGGKTVHSQNQHVHAIHKNVSQMWNLKNFAVGDIQFASCFQGSQRHPVHSQG